AARTRGRTGRGALQRRVRGRPCGSDRGGARGRTARTRTGRRGRRTTGGYAGDQTAGSSQPPIACTSEGDEVRGNLQLTSAPGIGAAAGLRYCRGWVWFGDRRRCGAGTPPPARGG